MKALLLVVLLGAGCTLRDVADDLFYGPVPTDSYRSPPSGGAFYSTATEDGETIYGMIVPGRTRPDVAILYCHGRGANLDYYVHKVERLVETGYSVAAFDYRGFGMSSGSPSEEGLRLDARAFLRTLRQHGYEHLVYYGLSLGGAVCIDLASTDPPAALVSESTFTSVSALVADGAYADLPADFLVRSQWDSLSKIDDIASPYLALHGLADTFVDPRYSEALARAHRGVTELVLVPDAGHEGVPDALDEQADLGRGPSYAQTVVDFVSRFVP